MFSLIISFSFAVKHRGFSSPLSRPEAMTRGGLLATAWRLVSEQRALSSLHDQPSIRLSTHLSGRVSVCPSIPTSSPPCQSSRGCLSARRVCVCARVRQRTRKRVRGSGCMSWPPPACRFMLLIGRVSLYTPAVAVTDRTPPPPPRPRLPQHRRRTDGGSDEKANEEGGRWR